MNRRSLFGRIVDRAFEGNANERTDYFRASLEPLEDRKLLTGNGGTAYVATNWVDITATSAATIALGDSLVYGATNSVPSVIGSPNNGTYGFDDFGTITGVGTLDVNGKLQITSSFAATGLTGAKYIADALAATPSQGPLSSQEAQIELFGGTFAESDIVIDHPTTIQGNLNLTGTSVIVPDVKSSHTIDAMGEDFGAGSHEGIIIYSGHVTVENLTIDGNGNSALNTSSGQSYNYQQGITTLYNTQDGAAVAVEHYASASISPKMIGTVDTTHSTAPNAYYESYPDLLVEQVVVQNTFWHGITISPLANQEFESGVQGFLGKVGTLAYLEVDEATVNNVGVGTPATDSTASSRIGILVSNPSRDSAPGAAGGDNGGAVMAFDLVSNAMVGIEANAIRPFYTKVNYDIQDATVLNAPIYGIAAFDEDSTSYSFEPPPNGARANTVNDLGLSAATVSADKTTGIYVNHAEMFMAGLAQNQTASVTGAYYGVWDQNNGVSSAEGSELGGLISLEMNLVGGRGTPLAGSVGYLVQNSASFPSTNNGFTLFGGPISGWDTGILVNDAVTPMIDATSGTYDDNYSIFGNTQPTITGNNTGINLGTGAYLTGGLSTTDSVTLNGPSTLAPGYANPDGKLAFTFVNSDINQPIPTPPSAGAGVVKQNPSDQSRGPQGTVTLAPHTVDSYAVKNLTLGANSGLNITLANGGTGQTITNFNSILTGELPGPINPNTYPSGANWNAWQSGYQTIGAYNSWVGDATQTGNGTLIVDGPTPIGSIWYNNPSNLINIVGSSRLQIVAKADTVPSGKVEDSAFVVSIMDQGGNEEGYAFPFSALNTSTWTTLTISLDAPTLNVFSGDSAFNLSAIEGYWIGSDFDFVDAEGYPAPGAPNDENSNNNVGVFFEMQSIATTSGSTSDQVIVASGGTLTINSNSALTGALATGATELGTPYTIVQNNGTNAVSGKFLGLDLSDQKHSQIGIGGNLFKISYTAGPNSNSVTLTETTDAPAGAPVLDLGNAVANYTTSWNNSGAVGLTSGSSSLTDTETALLNSMTVSLANPVATGSGATLVGESLSIPQSYLSPATSPDPHVVVTPYSYNATAGTIVLSGSDTLADYLAVLQQITYNDNNGTGPGVSPRLVTVTANDGAQATPATTTINVSSVPVVNLNAPNANFSTAWNNTGTVLIDNPATASIADGESATLTSMTVTLSTHQANDLLAATGAGSVTVTPYNPATGVLLLSGSDTLADYLSVLNSVSYTNSNGGPGISSETVSVVANDGSNTSSAVTSTIAINNAIVLLNAPNVNYTTTYTGVGAINIDNPATASIADAEASSLTSMTVTLTTHTANDVLTATGFGSVTVTPYVPGTGVLVLSGTDTLADYLNVLNSVKYNNTSIPGPGIGAETVHVQAFDALAGGNIATATINISLASTPSTVAGTDVFYSLSKFDGATHGAGTTNASDDASIDTSKSAYLPGGGNATFSNVTAYSLGINGIDVDLTVPVPNNHPVLTKSDFIFKLGNTNTPSGWTTLSAANVLTVVDRPGQGVGGSDRIEILFASNSIKDTWLEVRVKGDDAAGSSDTNTGLASTYTFFYGNIPGDTGAGDTKNFSVNSTDSAQVQSHQGGGLTITSIYDFNKDKSSNSTDVAFAEATTTALVLLNVSGAGPFAPDADPSADSNSVVSGISDLAASTIQSGTLPSVRLDWLASRLQGLNLNAGAPAQVFESLAQANTPATRALLVDIDEAAQADGLDDSLVESLLGDLGLS